jgi:hypothetical protein
MIMLEQDLLDRWTGQTIVSIPEISGIEVPIPRNVHIYEIQIFFKFGSCIISLPYGIGFSEYEYEVASKITFRIRIPEPQGSA